MKKILVPTDFSEVSFHAAEFAMQIAKASNASLIMLHSAYFHYFNEFSYGVTINPQPFIDELEKAIEGKLQTFQKRLGNKVEVETKISGLNLIDAVKDMVDSEGIDLIVVGTHGASGLKETFIGSNTERVVRRTNCPVIAVPSHVEMNAISKILVPLDILEIQDGFMKNLARLQKFFEADMEFVWVRTNHCRENEGEVRKKFNSLMKTYGINNGLLSIICSTVPLEGILAHATLSRANMIAMATHARRGIAHLLSGSITEDTINRISIPVWTYKLDKEAKNIDLFKSNEEEVQVK
ncbi:MAG: universal stress protein [Ekhidna sp.]